jgi:hypothetical protein
MNRLLHELLQLNGVTSDQANAIWRRLCEIVAVLLTACFVVFALNTLFGWHVPALILMVVFVPMAAFAWARPLFLVSVGIAGLAEKLASNATLAESIKDVFKAYSGVFKWATVVVVIYCFAMWLVSFDENISMAVTALFALAAAGVCLWAWPDLFPGAWARKSVYWGSVVVVICGLLSQIPGPYWIKYVGWAPSFAPTVAENMISDIRKAQAANKEEADGLSLEEIHKKVLVDKKPLTTAEESLVTKKEAEAKTVKALVSAGPSPSLTTVSELAKKHWLRVLIVWGILAAVIALMLKGQPAVAKTLQKVLATVMILVLIVLPTWIWITSNSSSGCIAGHPCVSAVNDDGSSEPIIVPKGAVACFDPWVWNHLSEVGLMISYQDPNGSGEPFPCSREQVYTRTCTATYDRFWFKPVKPDTRLPTHWWVASGSKKC